MAIQKRLWERGWTKGEAAHAPVEQDKKTETPRVYTLQVFLTDGPVTKKFSGKELSRTIQMRGDQTLQMLHQAIFKAFDRWEEHLHEFNFWKGSGKVPGAEAAAPPAAAFRGNLDSCRSRTSIMFDETRVLDV